MNSEEWAEAVEHDPRFVDLAGMEQVAELIADLAAAEKERDRHRDAAESWKDSYRECLARAEAAEKERDRYRKVMESCGQRLFDAADKLELVRNTAQNGNGPRRGRRIPVA